VSPLAQSAEFELKGIDSSERNSLFFAVSIQYRLSINFY
jgi:hypothetical protein